MTNGNDSIHNSEQGPQDGLTKREYFAAMAMQSILKDTDFGRIIYQRNRTDIISITEASVVAADTLIEQLNKQ